jgi:hypothetical protein
MDVKHRMIVFDAAGIDAEEVGRTSGLTFSVPPEQSSGW